MRTFCTENQDKCANAMQQAVQELKTFVQNEIVNFKFKGVDSGIQARYSPPLHNSMCLSVPFPAPSSAVSQIATFFDPTQYDSSCCHVEKSGALKLQKDVDVIKEQLVELTQMISCIANSVGLDLTKETKKSDEDVRNHT